MKTAAVCLLLLGALQTRGFNYLVEVANWTLCISNESDAIGFIWDLDSIDKNNFTLRSNGTTSWAEAWNSTGFNDQSRSNFYWNFFSDWQDLPAMVIGPQDYKLLVLTVLRRLNVYRFSVLARSITFLMSNVENWQEPHAKLLILYLTGGNFIAKSCTRSTENCTVVHEEAVELLSNGTAWSHLSLSLEQENNFTVVHLVKLCMDTSDIWMRNITFNSGERLGFVFAKTLNASALIKLHKSHMLSMPTNSLSAELQRKFTIEDAGSVSVDVQWLYRKDSTPKVTVSNADTGLQLHYLSLVILSDEHSSVAFNLSAGSYRIRFTNFNAGTIIRHISLKTSPVSTIKGVGNITGCQFFTSSISAEKFVSAQAPLETGCNFESVRLPAIEEFCSKDNFSISCEHIKLCDGNTCTNFLVNKAAFWVYTPDCSLDADLRRLLHVEMSCTWCWLLLGFIIVLFATCIGWFFKQCIRSKSAGPMLTDYKHLGTDISMDVLISHNQQH